MLSTVKNIFKPFHPKYYSKEKLTADIVESFCNSTINSLIFGFCHGSLYSYSKGISTKMYFMQILKTQKQFMFTLTPLFIVARVCSNFFDEEG